MRRMLLLVFSVLLLIPTSASSLSGAVVRTDPNEMPTGVPDVLETSKRTVVQANGVRRIEFTATFEEPLILWARDNIKLWIDSTGSGKMEAYASIYISKPEPCILRIVNAGAPDETRYCHVTTTTGDPTVDTTWTLSLRRSLLDPSKQIRWRLTAITSTTIDRAPDRGWYP